MRTVPISGLLGSGGQKLSNKEDLDRVAAWAEERLWLPLQTKRESLIRSAIVYAVLMVGALLMGMSPLFGVERSSALVVMAIFAACVLLVILIALLAKASRLSPDVAVASVHRVYWPLQAISFGGGSILYDCTGLVPERTVHLRALRDTSLLMKASEDVATALRGLNSMEPCDECVSHSGVDLYGTEAEIVKILQNTERALDSSIDPRLSMAAIPISSPVLKWLASLGDEAITRDPLPAYYKWTSTQLREINGRLSSIQDPSQVSESAIDKALQEIDTGLAELVSRIEDAHSKSLSLVGDLYKLSEIISIWTAYRFCLLNGGQNAPGKQSPEVSKQGPESASTPSLEPLVFDNEAERWLSDKNRTEVTFDSAVAVSKFKDELFYPMLDQFIATYSQAIQAIDDDVADQAERLKRELETRKQDTEQGISKGRQQWKLDISDLSNKATMLRIQIKAMTDTLGSYGKISDHAKTNYEHTSSEMARTIDEETRQLCAQYDSEYEALRQLEVEGKEIAVYMHREEEEMRHQEILSARRDIAQFHKDPERQGAELPEDARYFSPARYIKERNSGKALDRRPKQSE